MQAYYSLAGRELGREILPAVRDLGLGVMVWSPLAGGFLSGKYTGEGAAEGRRAAFSFPPVDLEQGDRIVEALRDIGAAHDASPARVALAWVLHQDGVTSVIVGARKLEQLEDNLAAVDVGLSADDLSRLDEVSRLKPEYPHILPPRERGVDPFAGLAPELRESICEANGIVAARLSKRSTVLAGSERLISYRDEPSTRSRTSWRFWRISK